MAQPRMVNARNRQARRDLPFRGRLSSGERQARNGSHRSRPHSAQSIDKSIRAYSVEVGKPAQAKPIKSAPLKRRSLLVPLAIAIAALFAIAGGAWYLGADRIAIIG